MQVDCVNALELASADIAVWRLFLSNQGALSSPFLAPEWASAVARRRGGVRVCMFREAGRTIGFLPVQGEPGGVAVPVGGAVCDYQAIVAPVGARFDLRAACRALDVRRIEFTAALQESAAQPFLVTRSDGHIVRLRHGFDAWASEREAAGSNIIKRARKKLLKLRLDYPGEVSFEAFSTDGHAFDQLLYWTRGQIGGGASDVLETAWVSELVRDAFAPDALSSFGGALFVLRVAGRPIAALFCLRYVAALHGWFMGVAPGFDEYAPAEIAMVEAIRASAEAGFAELDLGPGDHPFKQSLANAKRPVGAGIVWSGGGFQLRAFLNGIQPGRSSGGKALRHLDLARGLDAA